MRSLLIAAAGAAAIAFAVPAHATLTLSLTDNGVPQTLLETTPSPGNLIGTLSGDPNFSDVTIDVTGTPALPTPDLGTVTLSVSGATGAGHTLDIVATQTGLTVPAGLTGFTTDTYNGLDGSPGPVTETMLLNGAVLNSETFPPTAGVLDAAFTDSGLPLIVSNAEMFDAAFTGGDQDLEATMEFSGVSEPGTLGLLALMTLGLVGLRVKTKNRVGT
jgi:hypothetical protein